MPSDKIFSETLQLTVDDIASIQTHLPVTLVDLQNTFAPFIKYFLSNPNVARGLKVPACSAEELHRLGLLPDEDAKALARVLAARARNQQVVAEANKQKRKNNAKKPAARKKSRKSAEDEEEDVVEHGGAG